MQTPPDHFIPQRNGSPNSDNTDLPRGWNSSQPLGGSPGLRGWRGYPLGELALNILAVFLPLEREARGVELRDGSSVSAAAWELHQPFLQELIATVPRAGGTIPADMIRIWLATHPSRDSRGALATFR